MNKTLVRFGLAALAVAFGGCAAMSEVQTEPVPGTSAVGDQVEENMPGML